MLKARIKERGVAAEPTPFVYEVFDLLHLDGRSLLDEPLEERRRLLAGVLPPDPRVRLSEHVEADGIAAASTDRRCLPRKAHRTGAPLRVLSLKPKILVGSAEAQPRRRWRSITD